MGLERISDHDEAASIRCYVLESTLDLDSGRWVLVPANNRKATITLIGKTQFFRLKK